MPTTDSDSQQDPPADALSAYRDWLTNQPWLFAKTYADDSPHEYIVRTWDSVSESMFVSFATDRKSVV